MQLIPVKKSFSSLVLIFMLILFLSSSCFHGVKVDSAETKRFYYGLYVADSFYTDNDYYKYYLFFDKGNVVYYKLTKDDCNKVFNTIEYKHNGIAKYNIKGDNLRLVFSERIVGSPENFPPPNFSKSNPDFLWGFDGVVKNNCILMKWRNLSTENDNVLATRLFKLCKKAERKKEE